MKLFELLLLEYDVNKVNSLAGKLESRDKDPGAPPAPSPVDLAQAIASMGVRNGETLFWILNRYLTPMENGYGINRWEDISSRLLPALEKFDLLKRKPNLTPPLPTRDLNQIKSLSQLEDITEKYQEKELASKTEKAGAEEQAFYDSKQATLLYNDATVKVVIPHTAKASQYFGRNTRWCTAAKTNNEFFQHNRRGPLYIVLIKSTNNRYQFHWADPQFTDEQNNGINPNDLAEKYPVLWKIFTPIAEKNKSLILNQNPTPEIYLAAVQNYGEAIEFIKDPTPEMKMAAVKNNGRAIRFIKNPTPAMQMAAVQNNGWAIRYIENPTPEIQMAAVKNNGRAIQFIKNPTPAMQMAAVQNHGWAIEFIENPTPEIQMAAVKYDSRAIEFIENPTPEIQVAAVQNHGWAIRYIENPTPEIQMAAVKYDSRAIGFIKNPTPEVVALARSK